MLLALCAARTRAGGQGNSMKKAQGARGSESGPAYPALTDKSVDRNQALTDGIDRKEKTFGSNGTKQGWSLRRNKARGRDFVAIQSQPRFGYRPNISLSTRDYDALRAGRFQLEPFRQRAGHNAQCRTGVHKKLNSFNAPRWTSQTTFYVKQSHIENRLKNQLIVAQLTCKTNPLQVPLRQTFADRSK